MYSCAQPAPRVSSASCLPARLQNATGYAAFKQKSIAKLAGFQKRVAAAVNGAGRTLGVWDESFTAWGFAGTPMLPEGSMIFNWEAPEQTAAMTDAGCACPAVMQPCCARCALLCPAVPRCARLCLLPAFGSQQSAALRLAADQFVHAAVCISPCVQVRCGADALRRLVRSSGQQTACGPWAVPYGCMHGRCKLQSIALTSSLTGWPRQPAAAVPSHSPTRLPTHPFAHLPTCLVQVFGLRPGQQVQPQLVHLQQLDCHLLSGPHLQL